MSEFAVMAEQHDGIGKPLTLRRGFRSREDAEDHPVKMALWKRVWVEEIASRVNTEPPKAMREGPRGAARIEYDFALLEAAAISGDRCPKNDPQGPIGHKSISTLVKDRRIQSEIYMHNWRVVTILSGPHQGCSTKSPPAGSGKPYLVNGIHVGRIHRRLGKISP